MKALHLINSLVYSDVWKTKERKNHSWNVPLSHKLGGALQPAYFSERAGKREYGNKG